MSDNITGRVYRINAPDGAFYIGSTIRTLKERLAIHRSDCKDIRRKSKVYDYFRNNGWDGVEMVLLHEGTFSCLDDLRWKEREFVQPLLQDFLCLNTKVPIETVEERRARNAAGVREKRKHLTQDDKKRVNEQAKARYAKKSKEERAAKVKAYREKNLDHIREMERIAAAKRREAGKDYRNTHPEKFKAMQKAYNEKRKAKAAANTAQPN